MKKVFAFCFFAILFTSQVGYYFIYTIHQYIIKEEMERELLRQIPEASLEMIIAENYGSRFEWEETNKEFSLDGVLYDVVRIERSGGKTILFCINDKNEKQLLDNLVNAVNKNHDNKQGRNNIKPMLLDLVCMIEEEEKDSFSCPSAYSYFNVTLVSSFEEINSPPPKA